MSSKDQNLQSIGKQILDVFVPQITTVAKSVVEARPLEVAWYSAVTAVSAVVPTVAWSVGEARPPGITKYSACCSLCIARRLTGGLSTTFHERDRCLFGCVR